MNKEKILEYILMKILSKSDNGITTLNHPYHLDRNYLRILFKDIDYLVRMLIEDDK